MDDGFTAVKRATDRGGVVHVADRTLAVARGQAVRFQGRSYPIGISHEQLHLVSRSRDRSNGM